MEKLTQELTTAEGFCKVMNDNAAELGTDLKATMIRTEELDDGTVVQVEGMTPDAIKNLFNQQITKVNAENQGVKDITPGEPVQAYVDDTKIEPVETELLDGVVQIYNKAMDSEPAPEVPVVTTTIPEGTTDILGKTINELQNVNIENNNVTGTLNYVSDYTDFSSNPEEQSGNYLVIKVEATNATTITCQISEATSTPDPIELDEDGIFVARLHSNTQTITIKAIGEATTTQVLNLTGLTLEPEV